MVLPIQIVVLAQVPSRSCNGGALCLGKSLQEFIKQGPILRDTYHRMMDLRSRVGDLERKRRI